MDFGFASRWSTEARSNRTAELFRTVDTSHVVVRWAAVSRTTTPYPPYLYHPTPPPAEAGGVQPPSPLVAALLPPCQPTIHPPLSPFALRQPLSVLHL
ncbi:hypothetical protein K0M31_018339 [Melipona bicolor]|uniref:Uncharacterized protein n=1 Tax=Melipona bicolor TaxID=60889 RepID=A0AA40G3W5_9HYME|nr:hypothetical protein K0M31_018339 [Melipona bicolor]